MYTAVVLVCLAAYIAAPTVAMTAEQKAAIHQHFEDIGKECSVANPIDEGDIANLKGKKAPEGPNAGCFLACMYRKLGLLDDDGSLHQDKALEKAKAIFHDDEELKIFGNFIESCKGVNSEPVSDGAKGCERAVKAFSCMIKNAPQFALDL